MATRAQMLKKQKSKQAKARRKEIDYKYDTYIPVLQRSGNVRSIMRRVEQAMEDRIKHTKTTVRGKRMPVKIITT